MTDATSSNLWGMRMGFIALIFTVLFFHLLPLQTVAGGLIWPDFILAFSIAWSVRRPDYVPLTLLAILFLLADLLLQRPPGLWAVLALIACAKMQNRVSDIRDATLASEFLSVALWMTCVGLGYRIVLTIFLVDMPALGPALLQIVATILAYPVVVIITHGVMRVRKSLPGDFDRIGT